MDIRNNTKSFLLGLVVLLMAVPNELCAKVRINEIMPCNLSWLLDKTNNYPAWIEFYNDGSPVDLKGATMINLKGSKTKWSDTFKKSHIITKGYSILYMSGDEEIQSDDAKYLGYFPHKLEYAAGAIQIVSASGDTIVNFSYTQQYPHISYSSSGYMEPTPLEANTKAYDIADRVAKPTFASSCTPGLHDTKTEMTITLSCATEGAVIYYTTNGDEPYNDTTQARIYKKPFTINKSKAVRARAYKDGKLYSEILTGSFILDDGTYKYCETGTRLPIVSLVTDSAYLYDDKLGIYVVGNNGIAGKSSCVSDRANYNQDWTRPANFEYIEDGEVKDNQQIEIGVFGGCSRQTSYKVKSLKLKASKKTGANRYEYTQFFKEKSLTDIKSMKLRNGGNAYSENEYMVKVRCRDGFMNSIAKGLNVDYHGYQPVAYYINGVYKGLMGLREQTNEDYVYSNYGYDEDDINLLEVTNEGVLAKVGDLDRYEEMIEYVERHHNDKDFYAKLSEYMDVDEYVDYMIFEQFIVNTDWVSNNMRMWRRNKDGRFRWILYDTDFGLGLYGSDYPNYCKAELDMMKYCMGTSNEVNWGNGTSHAPYTITPEIAWKTTLFKNCIANEDFQRKYITRYLELLEGRLSYKSVKATWDSLSKIVRKDYCATFWPKKEYQRDVDSDAESMLRFAEQRPNIIKDQLNKNFGMSNDKVQLKFKVNCPSSLTDFSFLFNKTEVKANSYQYKALTGQSVKIEPILPCGYKIKSWELSDSIYSQDILLDSQTEWTYYYKDAAPTGDWTSVGYDDKKWSKGSGKFGYGKGTYDTKLNYGSDSENKYLTSYFRGKFNASKGEYRKVTFSLTYDDGAVVYLNGKEIARYNMDANAKSFAYDDLALDYVNDSVASFSISGDKLIEGENVVAIEMHQNVANSSDMTMEMSATGYSNPKNKISGDYFESLLSEDLTLTLNIEEDTNYKSPRLFINEVCASNNTTVDEYGDKPDWIEIYNAESYDVDLGGMILKNESKELETVFENGSKDLIIPAGGHKLLWADKNGADGPRHLDFKLSATVGQKLAIYQVVKGKRVQISNMTYEVHDKNHSFGRIADGGATMAVFHDCTVASDLGTVIPTPGESNGKLCDVLSDAPTSSLDDSTQRMMIYPNPASDFLIVELKVPENGDIYIYDNMGRQAKMANLVEGKRAIDVEGMADGVYIIKVITAEDVFTERFIKR